jgi:putative zinc finger/helix-turn-helix YgiT family protein
MTKKTMSKENFEGLMAGINQMIDHMHGKKAPGTRISVRPKPLAAKEVKKVRTTLGLTQGRFATVLGAGPATVQSWEQGLRRPSGSANKLMRVLEKHPELLEELARA